MFFKKKRKVKPLKIQDVSSDCPDYSADREEETEKKNKKTRKKKMRKIRKKKRNPFLVIFLFLLAAAGAAAGIYFFGIPFLSGTSAVYVERVSNIMGLGSGNGTLNRYAGVVESQGEWIVKTDGTARVKEVYVQEGDMVSAGDELFAYDAEEIRLNLEQARLELERMENELTASKSQITSLESRKEEASSSEQLEIEIQIQSLKANNKKTEYEMKNKNAEILSYEEAAENTVVVCELDGVVKKIDKDVMSGSYYGETDFITILAAGDYRIKASVSEQNQWSLSEGAKVIVRSRVDDSVTWSGTILTIDTDHPETGSDSSYTDSSEWHTSSKYAFYVALDSFDGLLLGQHVYVELDKGQDAVREGIWLEGYYLVQEEDKTYVWTEGTLSLLEKKEVKLGAFLEELGCYEILSGLTKDDYIAFPTEDAKTGARTTRESEESIGNKDDGEQEEEFQMEEEMFQEFDSGADGSSEGSDEDGSGPVGSIEALEEVCL